MPHLSNKALHFPTLHISDPTHECTCLSLKLHTYHCLHFTTRVKRVMHYTFQHCISLTPHMSLCVSLANFILPNHYIPLQEWEGAMCHPHICTLLYNLVNCFFALSNCLLQHPERSQFTVRPQFVECTQRSLRHDLGIILQLCEHFLLLISTRSVLPKHTPYCRLKLLAIT